MSTAGQSFLEPENRRGNAIIRSGTVPFYLICGLGGTLSAGGTHLAITPLDLIKCRMQTNPGKYSGIAQTAKLTVEQDGLKGLARGWAPTALGYGLQGFSKFAFYEVFKKKLSDAVGDEKAHRYRGLIYLASASMAEAIADVALAPFEAAKVRTQTDPSAPKEMRKCLFKGLPPLWMRQIPYTASKFICFEFAIETIYKNFLKSRSQDCTKSQQMAVTLAAGCVAGVVCAICSHPPDVVVSQVYKNSDVGLFEAIRKVGLRGMWSGLGARMLMISSIAAAQLFIVDATKMTFNLERPEPKY
ncbi:unnamed protein product [Caenorhabditis auriculariae]|uniref:Uncharacterized protein n=1 Tax=Caenorhabditis auriculariae TaxID=2777116 RepID=A0A8S1H4H1_9PELO|nr:unnamed protein product [Caenorhabditis auriculariae]